MTSRDLWPAAREAANSLALEHAPSLTVLTHEQTLAALSRAVPALAARLRSMARLGPHDSEAVAIEVVLALVVRAEQLRKGELSGMKTIGTA